MKKSIAIVIVAALVALGGCASQPRRPPIRPSQLPPSPPPASQQNAGGQGRPAPIINGGGGHSSPGQSASGPAQSASKPPPSKAADISSPAVMSLLGNANTLAQAGHMDAAAATLDRALDLEPRNPFIYQRLAAVRLAEGDNGQAEQLAMKSNSVSDNNPFVEASNWRLIAAARRAAGNTQGASRAQAQAVNFRQATRQYSQ